MPPGWLLFNAAFGTCSVLPLRGMSLFPDSFVPCRVRWVGHSPHRISRSRLLAVRLASGKPDPHVDRYTPSSPLLVNLCPGVNPRISPTTIVFERPSLILGRADRALIELCPLWKESKQFPRKTCSGPSRQCPLLQHAVIVRALCPRLFGVLIVLSKLNV